MNLKKLSPWNWFKNENEASPAATWVPGQSLPISHLHREWDKMFDEFLGGSGFPRMFGEDRKLDMSVLLKPDLDIAENEENYVITLEIPGVTEKDIKIDVHDNLLTVQGEKRHEQKSENDKYHTIERSYGSFRRTLTLPDNCDSGKTNAKFKNGILTVTIAKTASKQADSRRIPIE